MTRYATFTLLTFAAACSDGGTTTDAMVPPDIDNGSCGSEVRFTGEFVDWDQDQGFCGIFDALFQVQDDGAMDTTAPNGRFDLCVPNQDVTLLDITPPAAAGACAKQPGSYALPGIAVANKAVILSGTAWSGRTFTMPRQPIDMTKAQVFVHVVGTPRPVSLAAPHGQAQFADSGAWMPATSESPTGREIFFPDVDVFSGNTMLTVDGGAIGAGTIPLAAGKMTTVTVVAN